MKKLTFLLMAGFLVTVFSPAYAQLTPVTVTVSLDDNSQEEGDAGLAPFSVSINFSNNVNSDGLPSGLKVGVMVETTDGTATTSDNDYILQVSNKILTGPQTSASGVVALVGDTKFESDETLTYKVTNILVQENGGWDPTFVLADDEALLTIENDDPEPPTFYISDKSNPENFGSPSWSMNHVAGLSVPAGVDAYYEYSTSDGSATSEGDCADYESKQNFIQKIPAGQTIRHATYTVFDDGSYEPNETVNVTVHRAWLDDGNDTPLQMTSSSAVGTINNDDAPPTISIQDKSKEEDFADELRFPVKLSEPTAWDVYFTWKTMDGTATGGDDFTTVANQSTMIKGEKCRVYGHAVVEMLDDICLEDDETLQVILTGAYVDDGQNTPLQITD
ncbi:MAG: Calx-beta domain-containing protein, partial [candidate division KSB1 bacterium]|nr:Calx-beta domain-containing protein [candidate division KSB1 bacterium]